MHTVAPIWRAAALALPLVAAAGCDWIPVRRRLDPSLYPVPSRPEAAYLRDDRTGPASPPAADSSDRPVLARGREARDLPPLPELTPITPAEALALARPAPTPLLDAALVRAEAIQSAVFASPGEDVAEAEALAEADADRIAFEPAAGHDGGDPTIADPPESPPVPGADPRVPVEAPVAAAEGPGAIAIPPIGPVAATEVSGGDPSDVGIEPDAAVEPIDLARAGSDRPRSLAEEAGHDGAAEVRDSRRRVLDWLSEAEGTVDDARLWRTVMELLSEPDPPGLPEPPPIPLVPPEPLLRVAAVSFCREVVGFGRVDRLDPTSCRAGQEVIVYCELEGVAHEDEGDGHASRLSTTLEIRPEADASPLWRDVHRVEDRCPRPRRDYFVGYRLALPADLSPGGYRLRVSQRDLISGLEATGDLPFSIVPAGR